MTSNDATPIDAGSCPLCGRPNDCQRCTGPAGTGPCWCAQVEIPGELIAQIPSGLKHRACICRACVESFHRQRLPARPQSGCDPHET